MTIRILALVLMAIGLFAGPTAAEVRTIHSENSLYRRMFVTEDGDLRCLTFRKATSGDRQTCFKKSDPKHLVFPYTRMMLGALYLNPTPQRILVIGLGGGTLPMALREILPVAIIDAVEIDPAVVKVAREYFNFRSDPKLNVHTDDGRVFVKKMLRTGEKYDLVMLDAFDDEYIPEHLLTKEFLLEVKDLLTPNGVVAANTFSSSRLSPYESATYAAAFGKFYNLKSSNRVIWAQNGDLSQIVTIQGNAKTLDDDFKTRGIKMGWLLTLLSTTPDWPAGTRVLTDQYSPSNILNAK
jgi:spermidine synthase